MTSEEALAIVDLATDEVTESQVRPVLGFLGSVFDAADHFKRKVFACHGAKSPLINEYIQPTLLREIKVKFKDLASNFECSETSSSDDPANVIASSLDWKYIEDLKRKLKKDPKPFINLLAQFLTSKGILTPDTRLMFDLVSTQLLDNDFVLEYFLSIFDSLDNYFKTESGKRIIKILPQIMTADTATSLELFAREADYNQEAFFNLLKNGDMALMFLKQTSRFLISTVDMAKKALDDNVKFAIINGMLISNNFQPIDRGNLLKTVLKNIDKLIKLFAPDIPIDISSDVKSLSDEFERLYFRFDDFNRFTDGELENLMTKFLSENVLSQVKDAWIASRHVTMVDDGCAEFLICIYNENNKKSNKIVRTVVKTLSTMMIYSWTSLHEHDVDYAGLMRAIHVGLNDDDKSCKDNYSDKVNAEECDVFARDKRRGYNLSYEHNEL